MGAGFGLDLRAIAEPSTRPPAAALERLLDQLTEVLLTTEGAAYTRRPLGGTSGSIGAHVRHALDHIAALLSADPAVVLSYDHRERGTEVETDRSAALRAILRLRAATARWPSRPLDFSLRVVSRIDEEGGSIGGWSTLARELAFVVSHTIHHQAIIALLLAQQDVVVSDRFGYAPSTPQCPAAG